MEDLDMQKQLESKGISYSKLTSKHLSFSPTSSFRVSSLDHELSVLEWACVEHSSVSA